jgi:restriction system protein
LETIIDIWDRLILYSENLRRDYDNGVGIFNQLRNYGYIGVARDILTPCDGWIPCEAVFLTDSGLELLRHDGTIKQSNQETSPSLAALLLQTTVISGTKTTEGKLIEAVAVPWFDIIQFIQSDPRQAFQISPEKWEEIIAGSYKVAGFDEVTLTPRSGDLGRDVIAIKKGIGIVRVIDQVKAFGPGHLVTANDVRALLGVLQGDGASKGFLTTTSDFAPKLSKDPLIVPHIPARLELINGTKLLARLNELARPQRDAPREAASRDRELAIATNIIGRSRLGDQ